MNSPRRILAAAFALLALPACSGADLLNSLVPRQGYTVIEDQAYGEGPRRRFDFYLPDTVGPATPTIVFFYGGGWDSGVEGGLPVCRPGAGVARLRGGDPRLPALPRGAVSRVPGGRRRLPSPGIAADAARRPARSARCCT